MPSLAETVKEPEQLTDFGPPEYWPFLPPIVQRNYGKWKYHEILKPGVMVHVSESGEKVYTVRCGGTRETSTTTTRLLADLADKYAGGYLRFTSRNSIEFLLDNEENIEPLIKDLTDEGFPVGGMAGSVGNMIHTQGWLHCHTSAGDANGVTKAVMDELHKYYVSDELPAKLRVAFACCINMCGSVGASDVALIALHRRPPKVQYDKIRSVCEIPGTVAACPVDAISPKPYNGKPSVAVNEERCVYCGNCYSVCPAMPIADPLNDGLSLWVGGKISNARVKPRLASLAVPWMPNEPPRWPTAVKAVMTVVEAWRKGAKRGERVIEWIDRIGWPNFFKVTGFEFTKYHIDDYRLGETTMNYSNYVRL